MKFYLGLTIINHVSLDSTKGYIKKHICGGVRHKFVFFSTVTTSVDFLIMPLSNSWSYGGGLFFSKTSTFLVFENGTV